MSHLVPHIDVGLFGNKQSHDIRPALLRGKMQGCNALQGLDIGCGSVLKQTARHLYLVLLGSDVQRGVTILKRPRNASNLRVLISDDLNRVRAASAASFHSVLKGLCQSC